MVTQQQGQIYWITAQYQTLSEATPHLWGWKSSTNRFKDAAVWRLNFGASALPWVELYYLANHPYAGQSMDLAFEVKTPGMSPASPFSTWIAQFNLPPGQDDPDGDGETNLEEWIAGTDPGNANDVFEILRIDKLVGSNCVWWRIGTNTEITTPFTMRRTTNRDDVAFAEIANGIPRDPSGTNVFYDTNTPVESVYYRLILPTNHP